MIKNLVTMRIGGPAKFVITVTEKEDIPEAYKFAKERNLPVWVLGGGANTFSKDEGFEGVIILDRIMGISQIETPAGEEEKEGVAYFKAYGGDSWHGRRGTSTKYWRLWPGSNTGNCFSRSL